MKVFCDECHKEFNKLLSQIKRTKHNFCNRSCAGKFNGRRRLGPYKNNKGGQKLKDQAIELRKQNLGYRTIAKKIGVSWGTIRNWTQEVKIPGNDDTKERHEKSIAIKPFNELTTQTSRRQRIIEIHGYFCEQCKISNWRNEPISLELHHIDGNKDNNTQENLILLCPNCHSQTPNYRNKK